jgi:esterase/lipase superfamily enzyme
MIIASCRKGFDSSQVLSKTIQYRNYTNPKKPDVFTSMTQEQVLATATNKHVAILVHGFNNPLENVLGAYWELVDGMQKSGVTGAGGYGLVIGFTWPGFQTAAGFFPARLTAKKAGPFLRDLVNTLRPVAHTVDVETHSLGARVGLTALANPKKVFVDNLILTASAVDNDLLEPEEDFHASLDSCNRCVEYHSNDDPVLKTAYLVGDVADGIRPALGLKGPRSKPVTLKECPNVYVVDCTARVKSHGGYRKARQFYEHWKKVLSGGPLDRYDELS